MISLVVGGKALPKEITDQIIERIDGIQLFIEELTKAVIESGVVTEAGNEYQVTGPLTPLAIPTSLHGSLLARLDRLAPIREVAQIAAALGRQFSHELISAVAAVPPRQLDNALDQLVASELIFQKRGTTGRALKPPSNVTLLPLPPASPELNPAENVWQFMRQTYLSARVFDTDAAAQVSRDDGTPSAIAS